MSNNHKRVLFLGLIAVVAVSLGACREEEQGRLLSFQPGVFRGENPDQAMSKGLLADLRARAAYQAGTTAPVGGAHNNGISSIDPAQIEKLRLRAWSQSGRKE